MSQLNKDEYANQMLECAKWFHLHKPDANILPDKFTNVSEAIDQFQKSLLFEAHNDMKNEISKPDKFKLNAVDLETSEPGIVISKSSGISIDRGTSKVTPIDYGRKNIIEHNKSVKVSVPAKRVEKVLTSAKERAEKEIAKQEKIAEKIIQRQTAKQQPKEKKEKTQNKTLEVEDDAKEELLSAINENESHRELNQESEEEKQQKDLNAEEESEPKKSEVKKEKKKREIKKIEEKDTLYDNNPLRNDDSLKAPKKKRNKNDPKYFQSPVPHDRHLNALTISEPHVSLSSTLLTGIPSSNENLVMIQGPPGTGKTTTMLKAIVQYVEKNPENRCFICAPTNVGISDIYVRAYKLGLIGCLVQSKEIIPPDVPRVSWLTPSTAKLVFSTISGRNCSSLIYETFDACFVDEAAHCPESHIWGLLRPQTQFMMLVGDTKQLPATVSNEGIQLKNDRSIMERLCSIGVEHINLTTQKRMHPEIVKFPNRMFYADSLKTDYIPELKYQQIPPIKVYCSENSREEQVGTSYKNEKECDEIMKHIKNEFDTFETEKIVIITPYVAQQKLLQSKKTGIRIETVDSFQGKESEIVFISFVRTNNLGFWSDFRRVNVALTRAKHAIRIFVSDLFGDILEDAVARNIVVKY